MSVFDYLRIGDNTLLAAPQIMPSEANLTRLRNILLYGSFGGGYGIKQAKLMSTADELFFSKQGTHSFAGGVVCILC